MGAECSRPEVTADEEVTTDPGPVLRASATTASLEPDLTNFDPDVKLCKFACGKPVAPGLTRRGNPFDTCCRACALNQGIGAHDATCGGKKPVGTIRQACSSGASCRNRSAEHLKALAHPLDEDYSRACSVTKDVTAVPISLKVLFDWTDADGSGKLSREELEGALEAIKSTCGFLPAITDEAWHHLDEDGNGVVNFNEFASWAGPRLGLPLGLEKMMKKSASMVMKASPCSVIGCPCEEFHGDKDAKDGTKCKACKHKKGLHVAPHTGDDEIPYPPYWSHHKKEEKSEKFNERVELSSGKSKDEFQKLLDQTYRPVFTKDRQKHNPTNPKVPKGFQVVKVYRNENSKCWQEFAYRRAELQNRAEKPSVLYEDIKTTVAWKDIGGDKADRLAHQCNEWYLFHGTNPEAAAKICESDFQVRCAGSSTGTLYGRGLYFAESITKADEYAKPNASGNYAVLMCRVIGGNVRYTDAVEPDPEDLVNSCIGGSFDSVLGDREKIRGTYREFVLFDSEDVYVEYVIEYKRKY
eukprot:TRINITY_DN7659_c0_g1_i1.p1 TRINITY_DN7659_c0_g1~~TRINITY_DN7659_c0_g1_i1.p1  ORF type:complete len:526 (-),score=102.41 TRINITY_DN7659_c0_g1_i1:130-1707(-)